MTLEIENIGYLANHISTIAMMGTVYGIINYNYKYYYSLPNQWHIKEII